MLAKSLEQGAKNTFSPTLSALRPKQNYEAAYTLFF